jgi:hypothetical protein
MDNLKCQKCNTTKPTFDFFTSQTYKTKFQPICKECWREHRKSRAGKPRGPQPETLETKFWRNVVKNENCWFWTGSVEKGKPRLCVHINGKRTCCPARRYAYEIQTGEKVPETAFAIPTCGNDMCVLAEHLQIVTYAKLSKQRYVPPDAEEQRAIAKHQDTGFFQKLWQKFKQHISNWRSKFSN